MAIQVSRRALLGALAPSNRVTVGVIGVGRQTVFVNLKQFLAVMSALERLVWE